MGNMVRIFITGALTCVGLWGVFAGINIMVNGVILLFCFPTKKTQRTFSHLKLKFDSDKYVEVYGRLILSSKNSNQKNALLEKFEKKANKHIHSELYKIRAEAIRLNMR